MKNKRFCTSYKDFALVIGILFIAGILLSTFVLDNVSGTVAGTKSCSGTNCNVPANSQQAMLAAMQNMGNVTNPQRQAAAVSIAAFKRSMTAAQEQSYYAHLAAACPSCVNIGPDGFPRLTPGGTPDIFGMGNFADSPMPPYVNISGGGGTGAVAIPSVNGSTGRITGIAVISGGTGYTSTPSCAVENFTIAMDNLTVMPIDGSGATCNATVSSNGSVTGISLTSNGTGYTSPVVTFTGGSNATANVTGYVNAVNVTNSGSNYSNPIVTIAPPTLVGGTTATATATGAITGIKLLNNGSNYTTPTVTFTGGTGAAAYTTGSVSNIIITNNGSNYTVAPNVTIAPPIGGGTNATANSTLSVNSVSLTTNGTNYTAPVVNIVGGGSSGATANATGPIDMINVTSAGMNYANASNVTVNFTGGGGSGASANVTVSGGNITAVNIIGAGSGYTSAPTVNFTDTGDPGATGAAAIATINVTGITLTNGGSGYTSVPTVYVNESAGNGTGANAIAIMNVSAIGIINPGSNYTSAPTVTIDPAAGLGGVNATAIATISVTGIVLTANGGGYQTGYYPQNNPCSIPDGAGTGALCTVTAINVTGITVINGGSLYTTAPAVNITDVAGGSGKNATANATINITGIILTNGGTGFTSPANSSVNITDTAAVKGTGAMASVTSVGRSVTAVNVVIQGSGYMGIRKFLDAIPGLLPAGSNALGNYIPLAVADTTTFQGTDYYEIGLVRYGEKASRDLGNTTWQIYVQIWTPAIAGKPGVKKIALTYPNGTPILNLAGTQVYGVDNPKYLGPAIVASPNHPVRIKFTNYLPTGVNGNMNVPVDPSYMGAGPGPLHANGTPCNSMIDNTCVYYTQNRAELHLHGGTTPWISDGTPHQWTVPVRENSIYQKGVSVSYVPDMWFDATGNVYNASGPGHTTNNPGQGSLTYYYTNELPGQSARLMMFHDHAFGTTRQDVYTGEAGAYLTTDQTEQDLISGNNTAGANPGHLKFPQDNLGFGIPLVIQDKTFVPGPRQLAFQDPTWNWSTTTGSLWFQHVYLPNQDPILSTGTNNMTGVGNGMNAFGRWDFSPWFLPLMIPGPEHAPVPNPYYDCYPGGACTRPWENPVMPNVPGPNHSLSNTPETYMDTVTVNGFAYPYMNVEPRAYRFRILSVANDRMLNLQLYVAASSNSSKPMYDAQGNFLDPLQGEVHMVDAAVGPAGCQVQEYVTYYRGGPGGGAGACVPNATFPSDWLTTTPDTRYYYMMDGRIGGIPNPADIGPQLYVIGNEGGFLPQVDVINSTPVSYDPYRKHLYAGDVHHSALLLAPAERADVIVDFSKFAGKNIILYNDAPAAIPSFDTRNDYYTDDMAQHDTGGAPRTQAGYAPNTRTIMLFRVNNTTSAPYDLNNLTKAIPAAYGKVQPKPIVPESAYSTAFNISYNNTYIFGPNGSVSFFNDQLTGLTLTNGGSGYTSAPTVNISGGGGSGATATATFGGLVGLNLTNAGSGYTSAPKVVIASPTNGSATATVTRLVNGSICHACINVTYQGSGYTTAPPVTISAPKSAGGIRATASASVSGGVVTSINVINPGLGYTSLPTVTIGPSATNIANTATATATIAGPVSTLTVTNGGRGYTTPPTVTISGPGGGGVTATATATVAANGSVSGLTLTNPGSGYSFNPIVTIGGGGGTGATATATINGVVTALILTSQGQGYTAPPAVVISPTNTVGGINATASAILAAGNAITGLNLTNPGHGYTYAPTVNISGGGGTGATAIATPRNYLMQNKAIIEQFDVDYGRMNALLGSDLPFSGAGAATAIPYGYANPDPPTEFWSDVNTYIPQTVVGTPQLNGAQPITALDDGTQIWRIDHMGADTHGIHIHLINFQVINRITFDGLIEAPRGYELGWKDTFRNNPMENIFLAFRPAKPNVAFAIPDSVRPDNPALPLGATWTNNQMTTSSNNLENFGWEYVWHCHILSHEENDMMRPIVFQVKPTAPSTLGAIARGNATVPLVQLTWRDNSNNEVTWNVMRATTAAGPFTTIATVPSTTTLATGGVVTYVDTSLPPAVATYYYQVVAVSGTSYNSLPSNTASVTTI